MRTRNQGGRSATSHGSSVQQLSHREPTPQGPNGGGEEDASGDRPEHSINSRVGNDLRHHLTRSRTHTVTPSSNQERRRDNDLDAEEAFRQARMHELVALQIQHEETLRRINQMEEEIQCGRAIFEHASPEGLKGVVPITMSTSHKCDSSPAPH